MEKTVCEFIRHHKVLCGITFGLAIVGYLGVRAVKWLRDKCKSSKKVDDLSQQLLKIPSQELDSKSNLKERLIIKLPTQKRFELVWEKLGITWVTDNDDRDMFENAYLPSSWTIKKNGKWKEIYDNNDVLQIKLVEDNIFEIESTQHKFEFTEELHDENFQPVIYKHTPFTLYFSYQQVAEAIKEWGIIESIHCYGIGSHVFKIKFIKSIELKQANDVSLVTKLPFRLHDILNSKENITKDHIKIYLNMRALQFQIADAYDAGYLKNNKKFESIFLQYENYKYSQICKINEALKKISDKEKTDLVLSILRQAGLDMLKNGVTIKHGAGVEEIEPENMELWKAVPDNTWKL